MMEPPIVLGDHEEPRVDPLPPSDGGTYTYKNTWQIVEGRDARFNRVEWEVPRSWVYNGDTAVLGSVQKPPHEYTGHEPMNDYARRAAAALNLVTGMTTEDLESGKYIVVLKPAQKGS